MSGLLSNHMEMMYRLDEEECRELRDDLVARGLNSRIDSLGIETYQRVEGDKILKVTLYPVKMRHNIVVFVSGEAIEDILKIRLFSGRRKIGVGV